jgi:hypothetical protein
LHFFAGGLGEGRHNVRVVNEGSGPDAPYFGQYGGRQRTLIQTTHRTWVSPQTSIK